MLEEAIQFFRDEIQPNAYAIDHDSKAMLVAFEGLKSRGLLALKRPVEFGGPAMSESDFRRFQEEIARYSGALAFFTDPAPIRSQPHQQARRRFAEEGVFAPYARHQNGWSWL